MDCFSSLPPEINVMILLCLKTRSKIKPLLSASPTMLRYYCGSKLYIQKAHLEAELSGTLLQDALVVANFPSKNRQLHIEKWSQGQLPNPFLHHDAATIDRLDRLYAQFARYIEDYITKATSIHPPRAYMCIPSLCYHVDQLQFRGQPIGVDILSVDTLTELERYRLFQAFFRYELVSKIRDERVASLVASNFRMFSHGEAEALRCVYQYMRDLYGAVFAHHDTSQLPYIPAEAAGETRKLVPDDGIRCPNNIWLGPPEPFTKHAFPQNPISQQLGLAGFSLMTLLLSVPRDDRGCPMQFMATMPMHLKVSEWTRFLPTFKIFEEGVYHPLDDRRWDDWSEVGQALRDNGSITFAYGVRIWSTYFDLQKRIYRQRAWAFFDHAKYYPEGSISRHFPTLDQLEGKA
ncbi:uncharacterized protein FTJAE_1127 [Fusarium tjaetaba]|uniref:Uncharacterized protein n=1 Tax=Fusarium tjaetaba TaxID=1567544 RepID=A0A8H5SEJ4_9HYPO|nr:uncharacterized protein FTJAE_1127 [Fusarium tjaetaba]KAF5649131.1 hypothetical protein FTJAE_1127 [Fusarium tjaetaba]